MHDAMMHKIKRTNNSNRGIFLGCYRCQNGVSGSQIGVFDGGGAAELFLKKTLNLSLFF
jgi:hypothetical protein